MSVTFFVMVWGLKIHLLKNSQWCGEIYDLFRMAWEIRAPHLIVVLV